MSSKPSRAKRRVLEKVRRDVQLVKRHARAVVKIQQKGVEVTWNEEGALGVVAIVGPGRVCEEFIPEGLIGEIGLGPNRPWQRVRRYEQGSRVVSHDFLARFSGVASLLTPEQFHATSKTLFGLLREWTDRCVARRERGDKSPFLLRAIRMRWVKSRQQFERRPVLFEPPSGVFVGVPMTPFCGGGKDDEGLLGLFARDIFCADIVGMEPSLQSLANLLRLLLRRYERGYQRDFKTLKGVKDAREALTCSSWWLHYHHVRVLQLLAKKGKQYPLFDEVAEYVIGWNPADGLPLGLRLAERALPNLLERVGSSEIRVRRIYPECVVVFVATTASAKKMRNNGNGNFPSLPSSQSPVEELVVHVEEEHFPNGYPPSWDGMDISTA